MRRAGVVLLALGVWVAGCRDGAPAPTPAPTPSQSSLRFGYPHEPPTLDPLARGGGSAATRDILRPLLPALYRLTPDLRPVPELATEIPDPEPDGSIVVRLREAVWSDGTPITAADVRFSFEHLREGPTGYRYRHLSDVEVTGPRTFRLRFDRPMRRWWTLFSLDDMVLPAHGYSEDWAEGPTVSGGPFVFRGWTPGLRIRLERNDRYWGEPPVLRRLDVLFVEDGETRLALLQRGELDAFFSQGEVNMGRRAGARGWEPVSGELTDGGASGTWGPTWWELGLDPGRLGAAVAGAVVQAADPLLVAELLEDSGRATDAIPARFPSRDLDGPWSGRGDLDRARATLEGAGREPSDTAAFRIGYPRGAAGSIARLVHWRLRELGIRTELTGVEASAFERDWLPEGRTPVMIRLRRGADAPDAGVYTSTAAPLGSTAAVDEAVDAAESVGRPGLGLGAAAWAEVQRALAEAHSVAPLARVRTWIVAAEGVAGPHALGALTGPLWNAAIWRTLREQDREGGLGVGDIREDHATRDRAVGRAGVGGDRLRGRTTRRGARRRAGRVRLGRRPELRGPGRRLAGGPASAAW